MIRRNRANKIYFDTAIFSIGYFDSLYNQGFEKNIDLYQPQLKNFFRRI